MLAAVVGRLKHFHNAVPWYDQEELIRQQTATVFGRIRTRSRLLSQRHAADEFLQKQVRVESMVSRLRKGEWQRQQRARICRRPF